jgi:hypothetical protein
MAGVETALLFCAIRAAETLGTLSFTRDTRAGYEIALCLKLEQGYGLLPSCLTHPARFLDISFNPRRYGSVIPLRS